MKKIILIPLFFLVVCLDTHASAKLIYQALAVDEVNITPRDILGSTTVQKSVGGLTCTKLQAVVPRPVPVYECDLDPAMQNDEAIYRVLSVEEINTTPRGLAGSVTLEKAVGGLICQQIRAVVLRPVPQFFCTL